MWPSMRRSESLGLGERSPLNDSQLAHFADYLAGLKHALHSRGMPVTIVTGNEASDLDSMASSIAVAYFKHVAGLANDSKPKRAFVPMINIPRADLRLRPEVIRAFEIAFKEEAAEAVQASDLFARVPFRDEVDFLSLEEHNDLRVILTDHNKLAPHQASLADLVDGVLDHHEDERLYLGAGERVIDGVASCCTLAARLWMGHPDLFAAHMPRELALLLLEAILVDSSSLSGSVTTDIDKACAKFLYSQLGREGGKEARKEYFRALTDELSAAKKLLRQLKSDELLRRDCKEIDVEGLRIGISTISWSLDGEDGWIARDTGPEGYEASARAIGTAIVQFANRMGLNMVQLLLRKGKGSLYERQIVMVCRESVAIEADRAVESTLMRMGEDASAVRVLSSESWKAVFEELEKHADMDLEPLAIPGLGPESEFVDGRSKKWIVRCYTQRNAEASRKKMVPALQQVILKVAGPASDAES
ncbi:hypothetical protein DFJ74DRAFT_487001 [Hyaloraphidium curvatum]|nr:hypothetical protein DFJ74DRAFT_487001 [Hyaloraphidium curvatum]